MTKPEIIGSLRSTCTRAVCMLCEEKGIDYALTDTVLGAPELCAIHPFGRMPVLRHGDVALCESKAIATYLDLSFAGPRLIPAEPRLAGLVEQWVSLVNTEIDRTLIRTYLMAYVVPMTENREPDRAAIDAVLPRVRAQIALLDAAVAATGVLAGDRYTFADINLMPVLDRVRLAPEGTAALAGAGHLARYYERHAARPSFLRTTPPAGPPRRYSGADASPEGPA
jgi:glutathione S-transferase